jgi:hypothetical protein
VLVFQKNGSLVSVIYCGTTMMVPFYQKCMSLMVNIEAVKCVGVSVPFHGDGD